MMKRVILASIFSAILASATLAATAHVTFVPPAANNDGSTLAWASILSFQLVDTSKPVPGDIGTVVTTFTPPATAPAPGATVTLTGSAAANNPPTADAYVLRAVMAAGPGLASTPIAATIPLAIANAPTNWTLTFTNP